MKKMILCALALCFLHVNPAQAKSSEGPAFLSESSGFIFGPKRYKKRKIQRKNSVDNVNRRARKNQRKNGLGLLVLSPANFA